MVMNFEPDVVVINKIFEEFLKAATTCDYDFSNPPFGTRSLVYKHSKMPYYSTWSVDERKVLYIKLIHSGFFLNWPSTSEYTHEYTNGHLDDLGENFIKTKMVSTEQFCKKFLGEDCALFFYYDKKDQRADLKAFTLGKSHATTYGSIMITFKRGDPHVDYYYEQDNQII